METTDTLTMDDLPTGPNVPTHSEPSRENGLSLTTAFELLSRAPRRRLLYVLHQNDERTTSTETLARDLCARDGVRSPPEADDPERVRVALHHVHLPKLDEADVVEYHPSEGEVRYLGDSRLGALIEWGLDEEASD